MTKTTQTFDTLYDSETNDSLTADEIGIDDEEYDELLERSARSTHDEGHVVSSNGRRVYANY